MWFHRPTAVPAGDREHRYAPRESMTISAPSDQLRDVYEARGRLEYAEPVTPDPKLDRKFEVINDELGRLPRASSLLDAGCGDGRYLAALPNLGPVPERVVGVDIAESILQTAAIATSRAGIHPEPAL